MLEKQIMIETSGLTKHYGEIVAVDHLDLTIERGEVFGLLGPNGAGKTTTALMLLGLTEPSDGKATIGGHDCTREPIAVKRLVGYLPDSVGFYNDLTGRENLRFTGRLNGLDGKALEEKIDQLLKRVGMAEAADRKAGTYSRGMKQRLGIADVLIKDPAVIIMDEPTLGIDPEGIRELLEIIRSISKEDGRTILISSHQLYQVQQVCDRVGIFVKGSLIACGRIEDLGRQIQMEGGFSLELEALPNDGGLEALLRTQEGVTDVRQEYGHILVESSCDLRSLVTDLAAQNGYALMYLRQRGGDLDEIYRRYFEKAGERHETSRKRKVGGIFTKAIHKQG